MKRYVRCVWAIPLFFFFITGMGGPAQPKAAAAHHSQDLFLFDFGKGPAEKDYVKVNEASAYQKGAGYGFSQAGSTVCKKTQKKEALKKDYCVVNRTAFLADLSPGKYRVTVFASSRGELKLYAEGEEMGTIPAGAKGSSAEKAFTVSVEDGRLDLEWKGPQPKVYAVEISKVYQFDFGDGPLASGFIPVGAQSAYTPLKGYGFDDTAKVSCTDRGTADPLRSDFCIPDGTAFTVDLPDGQYNVRLITGDARAKTNMDVRANGMLQLYSFGAEAGGYNEKTFPIHISGGRLSIQALTARTAPRLNALVMTKTAYHVTDDRTTVFLAGDSTVSDYEPGYAPMAGWGQFLGGFFSEEIVIDNQAKRARSAKSFVDERSLDTILNRMKRGDYLLIQFGINDAGQDPARHTDPYTTFQEYLRTYIDKAREKGGRPVLVTSQSKRTFDEKGVFYNSIGEYPNAMRQLGREMNVPVIDLNKKSIDYYNEIGVEATKSVFMFLEPGESPNYPDGVQDRVHFDEFGANQLARLVTEEISDLNMYPLKHSLKK
ncbi:rhamnogalacturonan acetylesterase [Bacillus haynesii]|uniref:rhamnogalacturonan acetylesterase n=1 Tax=Bacillus haynesii TaxID=1925021 RepID=UPI002DBD24C8|nr:rhamnogalacturonan acetylesterase [Bacillus haynesii]MEC1449400.1 rhamnogalacturonan acetylesterase [Bacillus haynesii]